MGSDVGTSYGREPPIKPLMSKSSFADRFPGSVTRQLCFSGESLPVSILAECFGKTMARQNIPPASEYVRLKIVVLYKVCGPLYGNSFPQKELESIFKFKKLITAFSFLCPIITLSKNTGNAAIINCIRNLVSE